MNVLLAHARYECYSDIIKMLAIILAIGIELKGLGRLTILNAVKFVRTLKSFKSIYIYFITLSSRKLFEISNIYKDDSIDKSVGSYFNLFPCNDSFFSLLKPDNKCT